MATRKKPNVRLKINPRNHSNNYHKSESNVLLAKYIADNNQTDSASIPTENDISIYKSINNVSGSNENDANNVTGCSKTLTESSQDLFIAVIGSSKVGKTSLIEQLVYCDVPDKRKHVKPAARPVSHYPIVLFNEHIYNIRLIDCPHLEHFPCNSLQDWTILGGCNLREASGFILIFDITSEASFQHIKTIREQILELNIEVPMVIVANKVDLLPKTGKLARNNKREMSAIVKKHWKGSVLIECSTKYNWRVLTVFKELIRLIDSRECNTKPNAARAMHDAFKRNQCCVM